jgi:hypothetical protein
MARMPDERCLFHSFWCETSKTTEIYPSMMKNTKLSLRPTGLSSPAHADRQDFVVVDDGRVVGRIYEFGPSTPPDFAGSGRSRHSYTGEPGLVTDGRAPSLEAAKTQIWKNWEKAREPDSPVSSIDEIEPGKEGLS